MKKPVDELRLKSAKELREDLDSLCGLIDLYQNETELIVDELKRRKLKV